MPGVAAPDIESLAFAIEEDLREPGTAELSQSQTGQKRAGRKP